MSLPVDVIGSANKLIWKVFFQPKGDLANRLNSRVTVVILTVSSALLLTTQFVGNPITCWTPSQFNMFWVDFVNKYCFAHGTYFAPFDEQLSYDEDKRKNVTIQYYQWVPYVFALQAGLFYFTGFLWKALIAFSGFDMNAAIKCVDNFWFKIRDNDDGFKYRVGLFEGIPSVFIWDGIRLARKKRSRDMALFYTLSTVWQAINAWIQFYILTLLLNSPIYTLWGPSILGDLLQGNDWQRTGHFPRVVHCDFNRRRPASVQMDTVLCVLTLNIYYEKLFIFLWFWLAFVAIVSTLNCFKWIYYMFETTKAQKTIQNYLSTAPIKSVISDDQFFNALGPDGLFILHQMALNLGDIPTSYLTISMRNICHDFIEAKDYTDDDRTSSVKSMKQI